MMVSTMMRLKRTTATEKAAMFVTSAKKGTSEGIVGVLLVPRVRTGDEVGRMIGEEEVEEEEEDSDKNNVRECVVGEMEVVYKVTGKEITLVCKMAVVSCDATSVGDGEVPGLVVTGVVIGESEVVGLKEESSGVGEECTEVVDGSGQGGSVACEQMGGLSSKMTLKF